jgi:capsular polysaccharide transport system permease protein
MSNGALEKPQKVAQHLADAARKARMTNWHARARGGTGGRASRSRALSAYVVARLAVLLFVLVVPIVAGITYFSLVASDVYVSETRFAVRGGQKPVPDNLQALTGIPSIQIVQDTLIVTSFIVSRTMVEQLEESVGLRKRFSRPDVDWISRFNPDKSMERLIRYWKQMVDVAIEMPAGLVVVSVRAFTPEDSAVIARAVLQRSEALINEMNQRMLRDTLAVAQSGMERSAMRLAQTRAKVEAVRNAEGTLDAERSGEAFNTLLSTLRAERLRLEQDLVFQRRFVAEDAPQLRTVRAGIAGIDEQIRQIENQLTRRSQTNAGPAVSMALTRFAEAEIEKATAEKLYGAAAAALEIARIASEGKLLYLTTFVEPVAPDDATYPRRVLWIAGVIAASLLAWFLANMALNLAFDRR